MFLPPVGRKVEGAVTESPGNILYRLTVIKGIVREEQEFREDED